MTKLTVSHDRYPNVLRMCKPPTTTSRPVSALSNWYRHSVLKRRGVISKARYRDVTSKYVTSPYDTSPHVISERFYVPIR